MHHGYYDIRLVILSVGIAILTAYTTLDLAERITEVPPLRQKQQRWLWLLLGSVAMGTGIWAMHFIAMLAFHLPIAINYEWLTVFISVLPAIGGSGVALYLVSLPEINTSKLISGSAFMGMGIAGMHYIGMAAVRTPAKMFYDLNLVVLSVAVAVFISLAALWTGFKLRIENNNSKGKLLRIGSAIILGAAIPSMHYIGMMATHFCTVEMVDLEVDTTKSFSMGMIVGLVTLILLGWTLFTSFFNQLLNVQIVKTVVLTEKEKRLKQALLLQEAMVLELRKTQAQLIQAEKMLSLGQLVAGVAHEINNPVNVVYANLYHTEAYIHDLLELIDAYQQNYPQPTSEIQILTKSIDLPYLIEDLPQLFNSMRTGGERIKYIVESLRNFSRLDEAEWKSVDIHQGINSTLLLLQNRLESGLNQRQEIEIITDYGNLPLINCYASSLNQVFFNLINNAIDALEEKHTNYQALELEFKPIIKIKTTVSSSNQVRIEISNNGHSISKEVQQKMYDPFFTTKPIGKGTGLGLAICYQIIVQKHGGNLNCISTIAQTTFQIELPIDVSTQAACLLENQSLLTSTI